jgi:hypothetical protein
MSASMIVRPSLLTMLVVLSTISWRHPVKQPSSENTSFYFRCKINGEIREHLQPVSKAKHDSLYIAERLTRWFEITVINMKRVPETVTIALWDTTRVRVGIYRDNETAYGVQCRAILSYQPVQGLSYHSGGLFNATGKPMYIDSTMVVIKEMSDKIVSGTFEGKLYQISQDGLPPSPERFITITEGSFRLPITQK